MSECQRDYEILSQKIRYCHEIEALYHDIFVLNNVERNDTLDHILAFLKQDVSTFLRYPEAVRQFLLNSYFYSVTNQLNGLYFDFHKYGCNAISFAQLVTGFGYIMSSEFFKTHSQQFKHVLIKYFSYLMIRIIYYDSVIIQSKIGFLQEFENCAENISVIPELLSHVLDNEEKNEIRKSNVLQVLLFLISSGLFKKKLDDQTQSELVTKIRRYPYFTPSELLMIISCLSQNQHENMIIFCDLLMENILNDIPYHNRRAKKIDIFQIFIFEKIKYVMWYSKKTGFPKRHIKDIIAVLYNTVTETHYHMLKKCCELYISTFSVHELTLLKLFNNSAKKELNAYLHKFFLKFVRSAEERLYCSVLIK